jgi:hypothetical protein
VENRRFRPTLDQLEDRTTPSMLTFLERLSDDPGWMAHPSARPFVEPFFDNVYAQAMDSGAIAVANFADAVGDWLGFSVVPPPPPFVPGPDTTDPSVTINKAQTQTDPTSSSPIVFAVVFSEPVTGFTGSDILFTGSTVGGTLAATVTGSGKTYTVNVTGMTGTGNVMATIAADAATDAAGNGNTASTSTDNVVAFTPPDSGMTDTMPDPNAPEWVAQANGLKTWDVVTGTGAAVQAGDSITVFYTGWLASNGTVFDSRRSPADPVTFQLNNLIQGWQQGIPGMQNGGIRRLFVPSALGYGSAGSPPNIPPDADLVFEIKVISHT